MENRVFEWGDSRRYSSYSNYFKQHFGHRVQKVTINAGFSCPNRDGKLSVGGCTFCNNSAFNPSYCIPSKSVSQQINEGIEFHANRYRKAESFLAYFQAYSNTYKPLHELKQIYNEALSCEGIIGIVVGTRPDCVDEDILDYFEELSKKYYVILEYGVETCYDQTLLDINRGHDFATSRWAIEQTAKRGINVGVHFILGLPSETQDMMIEQTDIINSLPINTIKFHQLQVFKDTIMAEEYQLNPEKFNFFTKENYIDLFIKILEKLRPDIVVERFAGEAPPRFHLGPSWGMTRNDELIVMLEKRLGELDTWQGKYYK